MNTARFNGKHHDPATALQDMGFRDYAPGSNGYQPRHIQRRRRRQALGVDPWNINWYAFAGASPITGVELDGHLAQAVGAVHSAAPRSPGWRIG